MLSPTLPSLSDPEGESVPIGIPPVIDAHVHVFPDDIFSSIWRWFDTYAWRIRYRLKTRDIFKFLLYRGVRHIVALQYAHRPGIARSLNAYLSTECKAFNGLVTGLATVYPGEEGADAILKEAFEKRLAGVKLHAHVQCFDLDADYMEPIYQTCNEYDKPLVIHAGREPKSPAYHCDPYKICGIDRVERVLKAFPRLRICVPHLGFDETEEYKRLIEKYDTLWLDTTMMMADYFPVSDPPALEGYRADRIMYGSDFPNIPYSWDRELRKIARSRSTDERLEWLLHKNACDLFGIQPLA